MVSIWMIAVGAFAVIAAGAVAAYTKAGKGLGELGTGLTSFVAAPLAGTARGITDITEAVGGAATSIGGAIIEIQRFLGLVPQLQSPEQQRGCYKITDDISEASCRRSDWNREGEWCCPPLTGTTETTITGRNGTRETAPVVTPISGSFYPIAGAPATDIGVGRTTPDFPYSSNLVGSTINLAGQKITVTEELAQRVGMRIQAQPSTFDIVSQIQGIQDLCRKQPDQPVCKGEFVAIISRAGGRIG